jgi:N-methylhydantoinase A
VPAETWTTGDCAALRRRFLEAHEQVYGFAAEDEPVQVVNARLVARGLAEPPRLPRVPRGDADPRAAEIGRRDVYVDDDRRVAACPVYDRARLLAAQRVAGPAVIEQFDATTFVLPDQAAIVDDLGFLVIEAD